MKYPYEGTPENPPKYFYSECDVFDLWWRSRDVAKNAMKKAIDGLVKKIETSKSHDMADLLMAANAIEAAYEQYKDIIYLNTFLKCLDMLCPIADKMDFKQKKCLTKLIDKEREHVIWEKGRL